MRKSGCMVLLLSGLVACSPPPSAPKTAKTTAPARDFAAEVRAIGAADADTLEVQPLRDPAIEDLRATALRHEQARKYKLADAAVQQALHITPGDPELLQYRAEIALQRQEFVQAEQFAQQSFERGPKLGGLCRRNWATIRLAREQRQDPKGALDAAERTERCTVEPPVRM